jgi:hypothetical protein
MRRFLIYFLLVVAISGTIAWLFYAKIDVSRIKEKDLSALDYSMKSHDYNDFIFIGASRVREEINPFIIDSINHAQSFDVSIDGMGIIECNLLLNEYLQNHPKPKAIFLGIDFNMFYTNNILYNLPDYFSYLKDSSVYRYLSPYRAVYRNRLLRSWFTLQEIFATTDWSKKELILNPDKKEINYHLTNSLGSRGFVPAYTKWSVADERYLKDRMKVVNEKAGYNILEKMVERCRQDSVHLIFLYEPNYYLTPLRIVNSKEINGKVMDIASHYNIPVWNYSNIPIGRSKDFFGDLFHLNIIGANIFSYQLATDIKKQFYKSDCLTPSLTPSP